VSVTTDIDFTSWPFGGRRNVGEPTSVWRAVASSAGDASGTFHRVRLLFSRSANALSARFFSLGQLNIILNITTADVECEVSTQNLGIGPLISLATNVHLILRHSAQLLTANMTPQDKHDLSGTLIGGPRTVGTGLMSILVPNVDGQFLTINMEGYVWDQSQLYIPGGPRLPEGRFWSLG